MSNRISNTVNHFSFKWPDGWEKIYYDTYTEKYGRRDDFSEIIERGISARDRNIRFRFDIFNKDQFNEEVIRLDREDRKIEREKNLDVILKCLADNFKETSKSNNSEGLSKKDKKMLKNVKKMLREIEGDN